MPQKHTFLFQFQLFVLIYLIMRSELPKIIKFYDVVEGLIFHLFNLQYFGLIEISFQIYINHIRKLLFPLYSKPQINNQFSKGKEENSTSKYFLLLLFCFK